MQKKHIAVIGAGLSGLSAALILLQHGHRVTVYEAAPHAGGRARTVEHQGLKLDNGQHLLIGAYTSTLQLLSAVDVDLDAAFLRIPLALHMYEGAQRMSLTTSRTLPAPLHLLSGLLTAQGLDWRSKWHALRWMAGLRLKKYQLREDCSVAALLSAGKQTANSIRLLWEPLCIAALNTPIQYASAQVFLNVLRDSFNGHRTDSDFLIARQDLSATLITPLVQKIKTLGGEIKYRTPVQALHANADSIALSTSSETICVDQVMIAVGPHQRKTFLPTENSLYRYQPITTVYLQFAAEIRLLHPLLGLSHVWAQWVFDRGQCCGQHGLLAVVISAHAPLPDKALLISECMAALNSALSSHNIKLDTPTWSKVITEKRATFSCEVGLKRPTCAYAPMIWLAGDDVGNGYPATIEGTIRNGLQAASACLNSL